MNDLRHYDVVVVGGGPAGIAAATCAAESDASTVLVDDNPRLGGQIWRSTDGVIWEPLMLGGFGEPGNGRPYGMIVADNGSNWFISGVPDERWDNDDLSTISQVLGSNFEAVDEEGLHIVPDSALVPWYPGISALWVPNVKR